MTKKDYIIIADVLGNKIVEVSKWSNIESQSLAIAYVEDFIKILKADNPQFNKQMFIDYINKGYSTALSY